MTIDEQQQAIVLAYAAEVREYYRNHSAKDFLNILNMGDYGTGKTRLLLTCPKPAHLDCFDPGGSKTEVLQPLIESGEIIVDHSFEWDEWKNPVAYSRWKKAFEKRKKMGYFDYIATYMFDSVTTFSESVLYDILRVGSKKTGSRTGQLPERQDWNAQQMNMIDAFSQMMGLPCHTIVNGHLTRYEDPVSKEMEIGLLLAGKGKDKIPPIFDEKYISRYKDKKYVIQTHREGKYNAETRVGETLFATFEEPDFRALLKKAGFSYADKEPLFRSNATV